jgi:hypothetical protein
LILDQQVLGAANLYAAAASRHLKPAARAFAATTTLLPGSTKFHCAVLSDSRPTDAAILPHAV